jgi:hypothetical protein
MHTCMFPSFLIFIKGTPFKLSSISRRSKVFFVKNDLVGISALDRLIESLTP